MEYELTVADIERIVLETLRGLLKRDVLRLKDEAIIVIEPTLLDVAIINRLRELGFDAEL